MSSFDYDRLVALLGKDARDVAVVALLGSTPIERFDLEGFVEFRAHGVSLMLREGAHVPGLPRPFASHELYVHALHFHREAHEGYTQYAGRFPGDVRFGERSSELIAKLGAPNATGGGRLVPLLNKRAPVWLRYAVPPGTLHLQLDGDDQLEMVTAELPRWEP